MVADASNEIECIHSSQKKSFEVLEVRMEIYQVAEKWTLAEFVPKELWKHHPD
jgi:hypothetical protein